MDASVDSETHVLDDFKCCILAGLRDKHGVKEYNVEDIENAAAIIPDGKGFRADVYTKRLGNGELVAVKVFSRSLENEAKKSTIRRERILQYFERECGLWKLTRSTERSDTTDIKVVRLMGFVESFAKSQLPALVLEAYPLGDLRSFVNKLPGISEKMRLQFLHDVASGLVHCQFRLIPSVRAILEFLVFTLPVQSPDVMIVHRDIKGNNILIKEGENRLVAAITDFGSAKLIDPIAFPILNSTPCATLSWTPPEYIIDGKLDYSKPTIFGDVWSFGCTFIETLTGSDPWPSMTPVIDFLSGKRSPHHPPRPKCFAADSEYWKFLQCCFSKVPDERPDADDLQETLEIFLESQKNMNII